MLGSLAKWLRILGYDTLFDPRLDDDQLVRLARAEDRIILTRDQELARRRGVRHLLVSGADLEGQVRQVLRDLAITPEQPFSRCPACNEVLQVLDPEIARSRVPPYVAQTQHSFRVCPACQRIYWQGTHRQHMEEQISRIHGG